MMLHVTYHSPMLYESFRDASDTISMMGVPLVTTLVSILMGIHTGNPQYYRGHWLTETTYDFPFPDEPDVDVTVEGWIDFLTHYYDMMYHVVSAFVQPLPIPPTQIVVADVGFEVMVIDYGYRHQT